MKRMLSWLLCAAIAVSMLPGRMLAADAVSPSKVPAAVKGYLKSGDFVTFAPAEKWFGSNNSALIENSQGYYLNRQDTSTHNQDYDNGDDVQMWQFGANSKWRIHSVDSDGDFRVAATDFRESTVDKYWDLEGRGVKEGTNLHIWGMENSSSQLFRLVEDGDNDPETFYIASYHAGIYLAPENYFNYDKSWSNRNWMSNGKNTVLSNAPFRWRVQVLGRDADGVDSSWMGRMSDSVPLAAMNIPGTHDTGTANVGGSWNEKDNLVATQYLFVDEQLRAGVRAFDLRICWHDNTNDLVLVHGSDTFICHHPAYADMSNNNLRLTDVLEQIRAYLHKYPTETAILLIKRDAGDEAKAAKRLKEIIDEYNDLGLMYDWSNDEPTLGEVRGKMVMFSRLSAVSGGYYGPHLSRWDDSCDADDPYVDYIANDVWAQDVYDTNGSAKIDLLDDTVYQINNGPNKPGESDFIFNYTSCTDATPFAAAGRVNGWVQEEDSLFQTYVKNKARLGIVMMDYADKQLCRSIIESNSIAPWKPMAEIYICALTGQDRQPIKNVKVLHEMDKPWGTETYKGFSIAGYSGLFGDSIIEGLSPSGTCHYGDVVYVDHRVDNNGRYFARYRFVPKASNNSQVGPTYFEVAVETDVLVTTLGFGYQQGRYCAGVSEMSYELTVTANGVETEGTFPIEYLKFTPISSPYYSYSGSSLNGRLTLPANYDYHISIDTDAISMDELNAYMKEHHGNSIHHDNVDNLGILHVTAASNWPALTRMGSLYTLRSAPRMEGSTTLTWGRFSVPNVNAADDVVLTVENGEQTSSSLSEDGTTITPHIATLILSGADADKYKLMRTEMPYLVGLEKWEAEVPVMADLTYGSDLEEAVLLTCFGDVVSQTSSGGVYAQIVGETEDGWLEVKLYHPDFQNGSVTCVIPVYTMAKPVAVELDVPDTYTYGEEIPVLSLTGEVEGLEDYVSAELCDATGQSIELPAALDAGTYSVVLKTTEQADGMYEFLLDQATITVEPQGLEVEWTGEESYTYNGALPEISAAFPEGAVIPEGVEMIVQGLETDAGEYTARAILFGDPNYTVANGEFDYTIVPAEPQVNWPESASLVFGYVLDEATLHYADGDDTQFMDGTFSFEKGDTMPAVRDSGEFTLRFTPLDENYDEVERQIPVTISKREIAIVIGDYQQEYGTVASGWQDFIRVVGRVVPEHRLEMVANAKLEVRDANGELMGEVTADNGVRLADLLPANMPVGTTGTMDLKFMREGGVAAAPNYSVSYVGGTWTIVPRSSSGGSVKVYEIQVVAGQGGAISPSGDTSVQEGRDKTFTITPDEGYMIADVLVDGESVGSVAEYTFTDVKSDYTIRAVFAPAGQMSGEGWFGDVKPSDWYYNAVKFVVDKGMMSGYPGNLFGPNDAITRGQFVTILWRMENAPVVNYLMTFKDVTQEMYYTEAVRWAASAGIAAGYDNGCFGPDDPITRQQLATILWRYAQYKEYDVSVGEDTNILSYNDALKISEYAIPAMQWACGAGVMQGKGESGGEGMILDPEGNGTRAQVAAILQRFCENVVN